MAASLTISLESVSADASPSGTAASSFPKPSGEDAATFISKSSTMFRVAAAKLIQLNSSSSVSGA